jgi:hypothetical protein
MRALHKPWRRSAIAILAHPVRTWGIRLMAMYVAEPRIAPKQGGGWIVLAKLKVISDSAH